MPRFKVRDCSLFSDEDTWCPLTRVPHTPSLSRPWRGRQCVMLHSEGSVFGVQEPIWIIAPCPMSAPFPSTTSSIPRSGCRIWRIFVSVSTVENYFCECRCFHHKLLNWQRRTRFTLIEPSGDNDEVRAYPVLFRIVWVGCELHDNTRHICEIFNPCTHPTS